MGKFYEGRFAESILDSRREKISSRRERDLLLTARALIFLRIIHPRRMIELLIKSAQRLHLRKPGHRGFVSSRLSFSHNSISAAICATAENNSGQFLCVSSREIHKFSRPICTAIATLR